MQSDNIRLSFFGLPIIQSLEDFSSLTHISKFTIYQLSYHADKHYYVYKIRKKNGKLRTISQPSKNLKGLQGWILNNILYKLKVSPSCKGFEKGSSINDNAEPHKYCNALLTIDIKDFFPSIGRKKVYNIFRSLGYNSLIATILTNLCIYDDQLPQGSPCSPRLANLIVWKLDIRIQNYISKKGLSYTRYADDISISGLNPKKVVKTLSTLKLIINEEGFKINEAKTRIAGSAMQKKVTGLVLYDGKYGVGQKVVKKLRSKIFYLTLPNQQSNFKLLSEVQGWINYLNSVDKKRLQIIVKYINTLQSKYSNTLIVNLVLQ